MIEMHVHADPDVRARCIDQLTLTRQCKQNGYRGIMYKCHDFITNDIAYLLRPRCPASRYSAGSRSTGTTATRSTCRPPRWLRRSPAITAAASGCRPTSRRSTCGRRAAACPCSTRRGRCCPRSSRSWKSAPTPDIIFATGHSSPDECVVLTAKAKEVGVKKAVVTHASQAPWKLSMDQAKACIDNGAYLEHSVLPYFKGPHAVIPGYREQPRSRWRNSPRTSPSPGSAVHSTDLGQALNPNPVDGCARSPPGCARPGEGRRAERRYPEDPGHAAGAGLAFRRAGDHKVCKGAPAPGRIRRMYL